MIRMVRTERMPSTILRKRRLRKTRGADCQSEATIPGVYFRLKSELTLTRMCQHVTTSS